MESRFLLCLWTALCLLHFAASRSTSLSGVSVSSQVVKVQQGSDAVLPCRFTEANPAAKVVWTDSRGHTLALNSMLMTHDNRFMIEQPYQSEWNLRISNVRRQDAKTYYCYLNSLPPKRREVILKVTKPKKNKGKGNSKKENKPGKISPPCAPSWMSIPDSENRCMMLFTAKARSNRAAKNYCRKRSGSLITVKTEEAMQLLQGYALSVAGDEEMRQIFIWVDAHLPRGGEWIWGDGTNVTVGSWYNNRKPTRRHGTQLALYCSTGRNACGWVARKGRSKVHYGCEIDSSASGKPERGNSGRRERRLTTERTPTTETTVADTTVAEATVVETDAASTTPAFEMPEFAAVVSLDETSNRNFNAFEIEELQTTTRKPRRRGKGRRGRKGKKNRRKNRNNKRSAGKFEKKNRDGLRSKVPIPLTDKEDIEEGYVSYVEDREFDKNPVFHLRSYVPKKPAHMRSDYRSRRWNRRQRVSSDYDKVNERASERREN